MRGQGGRIARKDIWVGWSLLLGFLLGNLLAFCFCVSWSGYYSGLLKKLYGIVQSISLTETNYLCQQFLSRLREILLVSLIAISPWSSGLLFLFFMKKGVLCGVYFAMNARVFGFSGFLAGFTSIFPQEILFLFLQYVVVVLLIRRRVFFVGDANRGIWMIRVLFLLVVVSIFILLFTYLEVVVGIPLQKCVYEKFLEKILY